MNTNNSLASPQRSDEGEGLKPCPFCGTGPEYDDSLAWCETCNFSLPQHWWNRRSAPPSPAAPGSDEVHALERRKTMADRLPFAARTYTYKDICTDAIALARRLSNPAPPPSGSRNP